MTIGTEKAGVAAKGSNARDGALPLVVQLGFAGSRALFKSAKGPVADASKFDAEIENWLANRITRLRSELGLEPRHFFCGISQVAIGADTIFCKACRSLNISQRVFLPQHRDEYLRAAGSDGTPDFSPDEQAVAREILDGPNVIQQHVASESPDRNTRFEETNLEIAQASDVVICLTRADAAAKVGGTRDLVERAAAHGKAVLEIRVSRDGNCPRFDETWHGREQFRLPRLPSSLTTVELASDSGPAEPSAGGYCNALKHFGSLQAAAGQTRFKTAAIVIIGTHVLATLLAALALAAHRADEIAEAIIPWLLGIEVVSLGCGLAVHQMLHHSRAAAVWAMSRLVAEVGRSVLAVGSLHAELGYLFSLPFPESLRPVLRTINVLHLKCSAGATFDWQQARDAYIAYRLDGEHGQIAYYSGKLAAAKHWLTICRRAFLVCSATALVATLLKLSMVVHLISHGNMTEEIAPRLLGALAIVLPTVAVGALSLAAALDLEAREHTYHELNHFLIAQRERLARCSKLSLPRLVLETETQLLAETANWFSRRSFTGVA